MRIISGIYGGRNIDAPKTITRPTTDRVKESLFSMLDNIIDWKDIVALDLFAGSGSLGLETLSKGAEFVLFNDKLTLARMCIKDNCKSLNIAGKSYQITAFDALKSASYEKIRSLLDNKQFDLVFLDPPYEFDTAKTQLIIQNLLDLKLLKNEAIILLESAKGHTLSISQPTAPLTEIKQKSYGNTVIQVFSVVS